MAEVLDQSEVDALLASVAETGSRAAASPAGSTPLRGAWTRATRDVEPYDFKRPERVSKDQMRALEGIHEGFARSFGASLSGLLRTIVEVRVAICEQLTYSEFVRSLPSPTCFNLLRVSPLTGQMCLEISPLIIYPILDRLMGGNSSETFIPQRPLTNIEQRLVNRITERALAGLTEAWSHLTAITFELSEVESNPQLVQIVAPNEVIVVVGFEIKMGARSGTMSLCIPFNVIEPVMQKLATQGWLAYSQRQGRTADLTKIERGLEHARVEARALLARTRISVREAFSLAAGDVIHLGKSTSAELLLQINGRNKYAGRIGQRRGNRAFQVTRPVREDEEL